MYPILFRIGNFEITTFGALVAVGALIGLRVFRSELRRSDLPLEGVDAALIGVLGILALPPVIVLTTLLALRVRARVALVPILSFPILIPQLVACTQGAAAALTGDASAALGWAGILAAFALVYGVLGLTIVPAAIE